MRINRREMLIGMGAFTTGALAAHLPSCGGGPGDPTPVPTSTPAPTPTPHFMNPLRRSGGDLLAGETPIFLYGLAVCCEGYPQNGWPRISFPFIQEAAMNGINMVHIRLGPFMPETTKADPLEDCPYYFKDGKVDLNVWYDKYWEDLRKLLYEAERLGVYVEIDLIDAWLLKYPEIHPWTAQNNINGFDRGSKWPLLDGEITQEPYVEKWIRKVIKETGDFPNVYYQDGNELFIHPEPSIPYLESIINVVRDEEKIHGFKEHLIATNSHREDAEGRFGLSNFHQDIAFPINRKQRDLYYEVMPRGVNEYGGQFSPEEFKVRLQDAIKKGTFFILWRGGWNDEEYKRALSYVKEVKG